MNKKQIEGFEEYFITEEGWVLHGEKPLKIQFNAQNVPFVRLRKDGDYFTFPIAKLVALNYLPKEGRTPSDIVCYKDGNNHNFSLENLYWSSRSEAYSKLYNKDNRYSEERLRKLRQKICKPVMSLTRQGDAFVIVKEYQSITDAAKEVGVAPASLIRCLKNRDYMSAGYHWRYIEKENK